MELIIANDLQNNLNQATIKRFVSHLAEWNRISNRRQETKMIQLIQKKLNKKAQRFFKSLEHCLA